MGAASDALSTQCLSRPGACAHCRAPPCCRWGTGPRFVARTWTTKIHIWLPQMLEQRQPSLSRPVKLMTPSRAARCSAVWCHASVDDRPGGEAAPEWQRARGETGVSGPRALGQSSGNRVRCRLLNRCLTLIVACIIYWQAKDISRVIRTADPERHCATSARPPAFSISSSDCCGHSPVRYH